MKDLRSRHTPLPVVTHRVVYVSTAPLSNGAVGKVHLKLHRSRTTDTGERKRAKEYFKREIVVLSFDIPE